MDSLIDLGLRLVSALVALLPDIASDAELLADLTAQASFAPPLLLLLPLRCAAAELWCPARAELSCATCAAREVPC